MRKTNHTNPHIRLTPTQSIIEKWKKQECFIRHINGNKLDNRRENLQIIDQYDFLVNHFDDGWTVDWMIYLTKNEMELVNDKNWRKGLFVSKV